MSAYALTSVLYGAPGRYKVTATAASGIVYWWLGGNLIQYTDQDYVIVSMGQGSYIEIEAFSLSTETPSATFPQRITLQWPHDRVATSYRVEEYISAAWVTLITILAQTLGGVHRYTSAILDDDTEHTYRVVPLATTGGAAATEGPVWSNTVRMVRRPDAPAVLIAFDAVTGKIALSEATTEIPSGVGFGDST